MPQMRRQAKTTPDTGSATAIGARCGASLALVFQLHRYSDSFALVCVGTAGASDERAGLNGTRRGVEPEGGTHSDTEEFRIGIGDVWNGRITEWPMQLPPVAAVQACTVRSDYTLYSVTYAQRRIRYMGERNRIRYQSVIKIHQAVVQFAEIRRRFCPVGGGLLEDMPLDPRGSGLLYFFMFI